MCSFGSVSESARKWFLFRVIFLVRKRLVRLAELVFHLFTVVNLSRSLKNDPVVRAKSALDDVDVLQFIPDEDLALMRHVIFVDDENVPLVENLEGRPLRDNKGVF